MTSPYPAEPNIQSSGEQEPGGPVPRYEGRQTTGKTQEELAQATQKKGEGLAAGAWEVSKAEREGVAATDTTAASPLGVGVSKTKSGNERLAGSSEEKHRSDQMDTGVGGHPENVDRESPTTIVGDQGG